MRVELSWPLRCKALSAGLVGSIFGSSSVAGNPLCLNSGYTNYGTAPGNVLLAFSVDGQ